MINRLSVNVRLVYAKNNSKKLSPDTTRLDLLQFQNNCPNLTRAHTQLVDSRPTAEM
jgi:hypothetical protein